MTRNKQTTLDREAEVVRLRRGGLTFDQIATRTGYASPGAAHLAWQRANKRIIRDDVDYIRRVEEDRLDMAQAAIWPQVLRGEVSAVTALLRIMERRSKLLGLDMPIQIKQEIVTYEGGTEIDKEVQRLAELLASSEAAACDSGGAVRVGTQGRKRKSD
jgi:hypothetical protein